MTRTLAVSLCLLGAMVAAPTRADVRGDYKTPLFTIPFTAHVPNIDGKIVDAQWDHALSINALQTTEGAISTRQTRFWLTWDADHIYIAMRSPLRQGERLVQAHRRTGRDDNATVFDDSYELWLNAFTQSPDGQDVFFQYLGNFAGVKYDVMFEPAVGNSRPGWESGWKPANRITPDGKFWECEVAVPRQSIYRQQPFADGEILGGLLIRNYKRPWEQNSVGGSGSFSAPDTHCRFLLSKSAPAVQLLGVADAQKQTLGLDIAAAGTEQTLKWSFASDGGVKKSGELRLAGGNLSAAAPQLDLDRPGSGYYRIRVTSADGATTWLDWCGRRAFGQPAQPQEVNDRGDDAQLTLSFNPVCNYVRIDGDLLNYDNRGTIARYQAQVVDAAGKVLAEKELKLDELAYVHGLLQLGDCPPGSYTARLSCFDAGGKVVLQRQTEFAKKDPKEFAWWNTSAGNIEQVLAPWTALKHDGNRIDCWGRSMTIGAAGLPAQVSTQGSDMLAGPVTLIAQTASGTISATAPTLRTQSDAAHRVVVGAESRVGDIAVSSRVTAEFDGMYKIDMILKPDRPTAVQSLRVVVPIKSEFARFYHACGEGIRYGFSYGYVPETKTGRLWSSAQVDGQPMLVGSFIPYVWIGNDRGGLDWFADSDAGWTPSDAVPAIEIRRDAGDHVDLVLNLIGAPTQLDSPRTITFAFQATPVKPIQEGWRMETWWTGDSFQDFCRVEPKGGHLIWNALPFTLDPEACRRMVDDRHRQTTEHNMGITKYHANAVPYFENNSIDAHFAPEVGYFGDQWRAKVSSSLYFDKSFSDYLVYHLGQWCAQTGIDGWYVDNVRPVADDNIDAGRGYRLSDGRIQPTYGMFATRELFLRVRAVFAENGKSGKFVLHMTHHMIMPWLGAADIALDGEDHVTFPSSGKDFMDFWSPTRMRLDYPAAQGTVVTFLQEYQGRWKSEDLHRVMRAYTGMCLLNDVLPGANPNAQNKEVWQGRDRFGIEAADVKFIPYWLTQEAGIWCGGKGVALAASAWTRPHGVLIALVNTGESGLAMMRVDTAKLGLGPAGRCSAIDAETGAAVAMEADGGMHMSIDRHDYREVMITAGTK